jgi:hypothetical protein
MPLIRPIEQITNFHKLKDEVLQIIENIGFEDNQIILQSKGDIEEWHVGIGSIDELDEKDETLYCNIHKSIEHTEIARIIKKHNGYRARIIALAPRRCYSVHADYSPRMHVPIETNDQCWMIWPYENHCTRMPAGYLYLTDTTKEHTFFNGSLDEKRIHLMFCINRTK